MCSADAQMRGRRRQSGKPSELRGYQFGQAGWRALAQAWATAAGWGGAGPGLSAESERPRCVRILRMTPGSWACRRYKIHASIFHCGKKCSGGLWSHALAAPLPQRRGRRDEPSAKNA